MIKSIGKVLIRNKVSLPRTHINDYLKWTTLGEVLGRLRINCVLDVGANRGQFASTLRSTGYDGQIISFEPLPSEFAVLSQRFKGDSLWRGLNYALGENESVMPFNQVVASTGLSSFHNLKSSDRDVRVIHVAVKRLDSVYSQILDGVSEPRVFLKCDTQGFDYSVIAGAEGVIGNILGIQSEIVVSSPYYENTIPYHKNLAKYEALGFSLMGMFDGAFSNKTNAVGEIDCILARVNEYANAE